jgi:putative peptidoglycan lipid II flippase
MKKTVILLMLITIFSKSFGFIRDIILSYYYGASDVSDIFLIALTIPNVIFGIIAQGISTGYIPMYTKIQKDYGLVEGNKYTNNLLNLILLICTIIIIIGLIYTEQIVKVFASGFTGETLALAIKFTRISLFGIYFTGAIYIFKGFLQIKGNHSISALISFPMNFLSIISIFVSSITSSLMLAIGSVIATASQLVFVLPSILKNGFRYTFTINLQDKNIRTMGYLALPVIIGVSVNQLNVLVNRTLASNIAVGGVSAIHYASTLNGFVQGIFVLSITTVMYPMISKMAAEHNMIKLKGHLTEAIGGVNLLVLPASVGIMVLAEPVISLLYGRGAFDSQAISMTSEALFFYSFGMVAMGLREVLARVFYSLQDTKTPMVNAAIAMLLNIILNIVLSRFLGIGGLALATSISSIVCTILLFINLRKRIGAFGLKKITRSFLKIFVASLMMGFIVSISNNLMNNILGANVAILSTVVFGFIFYFVVIYFMKIEEVVNIVSAVLRKYNLSRYN